MFLYLFNKHVPGDYYLLDNSNQNHNEMGFFFVWEEVVWKLPKNNSKINLEKQTSKNSYGEKFKIKNVLFLIKINVLKKSDKNKKV